MKSILMKLNLKCHFKKDPKKLCPKKNNVK